MAAEGSAIDDCPGMYPISLRTGEFHSIPCGPPTASGALYTKISNDQDGRKTVSQQASGSGGFATASWTYTKTGKVASVTDTSGNVTSNAYGTADRLATVTDAEGRVTNFVAYDGAGRVLTIKKGLASSLAQAEALTYHPTGAVKTRTHYTLAGAGTTTYNLDGFDRPGYIVWADGASNALGYDADDDVIYKDRRTPGQALVQSVGFGYDVLHRLSTRTATDQSANYQYDFTGRMTTAAVVPGNNPSSLSNVKTWGMKYDHAGRRIWEARLWDGRTIGYQNDGLGNATIVRALNGSYLPQYDALNQMTAHVWANRQNLWSTAFDSLYRPQYFYYGENGGFGDTYTYGNPFGCTNANGGGNGPDMLERFLSLGATMTPFTALDLHYCYNNAHQLKSVTTGHGGYVQDNAGLHPAAAGSASATPNLANQVTASNATLTYDANGFMIGDGTRSYTYDQRGEGKVMTMTVGGQTWSYD